MDTGSNLATSLILNWKIGFEIELVAPSGVSRRDLARQVAGSRGASVHTFFHPQSELSEVPGKPVFENLTAGFAVVAPDGTPFAAFVDDLTLQADLCRSAPPVSGWYRIVADDARLLRLVMRHCDPGAPLDHVLEPLASLFGTAQQPHESGMVRVTDDRGVSVAICAPLPGERERTCEIITAPIEQDHGAVLSELLGHARSMGFKVPREGATHLHFDADCLCSAPVIARLVQLFDAHRDALRTLVGVNPNCIRLGAWPAALGEMTRSQAFQCLDWPEATVALANLKLVKYCDFNLVNLLAGNPDKHTFEIRILPSSLNPAPILAAASFFEALLRYCCRSAGGEDILSFEALLSCLDLPPCVLPALAGLRST